MIDVQVFDASVVVSIANLEFGRGRGQTAQLERSRQIEESVTRFGKLGATRLQVMHHLSSAFITQNVTVFRADGRIAIVQTQDGRL